MIFNFKIFFCFTIVSFNIDDKIISKGFHFDLSITFIDVQALFFTNVLGKWVLMNVNECWTFSERYRRLSLKPEIEAPTLNLSFNEYLGFISLDLKFFLMVGLLSKKNKYNNSVPIICLSTPIFSSL